MNWLRAHQRSAWIVCLTLLLPLSLYLYGLVSLFDARQDYKSDIQRLMPRIARMQGLIDHEQQLRESSGVVEQRVADLVYPVTQEAATISATLQKDVREILVASGLSVTNSQVLPVVKKDSFEQIGIRLTVSGGIDGLDEALAAIAEYTPILLVESLTVAPARASRRGKQAGEQQTLTVTLQLLSMRTLQ